MKVDVKKLAKWLAEIGLEYPYSCDWPTDKNDSAVLWEYILRKRFEEERTSPYDAGTQKSRGNTKRE